MAPNRVISYGLMWIGILYEMIEETKVLRGEDWLLWLESRGNGSSRARISYQCPNLGDLDIWPFANKLSVCTIVTRWSVFLALRVCQPKSKHESEQIYLYSCPLAVEATSSRLSVPFSSTFLLSTILTPAAVVLG